MAKLSKEERKRMRSQAEESIRVHEFVSHVISPSATLVDSSPNAIVEDAARVCVAIEHNPLGKDFHQFGVPDASDQFSVTLEYCELSDEILLKAESYEWPFSDVEKLAVGLPTMTLRARVNADPAIDFLHQTMLRVLGRLTHGTLISGTVQYVGDDWISWSLDYNEPDMFLVNRVYDSARPSYSALAKRFPQLRLAGA